MDDYNIHSLNESKNEWCIRLVNVLTYHIIEGFKSIFVESWKLCKQNNEQEKYLMTFQNMISQIPVWNANLIKNEKNRIINNSNCNYLEDLITCVHIIQLKLLTCIRVSQKSKKIELTIPSVDDFIHNVYISIARKLYTNIYLFERNISPLLMQKNNREFEIIVQNCVLNCVRDNIPVDEILKCYLEEQETKLEDLIKDEKVTESKIITPEQEKNTIENTIENRMKSILDERDKIENKTSNVDDFENKISSQENENNSMEGGHLEIINDEEEENKTNFEFKLKDTIKDTIDSGKKSLSFSDTVKAVDEEGEVEEFTMDMMEERRREREEDLFSGFEDEDDEDEKLTITTDKDNQNIEFEYLEL
tara:strand:+ start:913 stop:2001 length:1089 start_codon:yes stop_codon:yes gene_type:complete